MISRGSQKYENHFVVCYFFIAVYTRTDWTSGSCPDWENPPAPPRQVGTSILLAQLRRSRGSYTAPSTLLLSTETPQTHRRLTTVRRNTIEAHLCIADLVTRAACCLYLPLTATRSEKGPAMASPSSLLGEVAKGAPWQYLHTNMVLGETVDGWCWPKCREQDSHACWYLAMSRLAEV